MKKLAPSLLSMLLLSLPALPTYAQAYSPTIVGYVTLGFQTGQSYWFGNPLDEAANDLNSLFFGSDLPTGTALSLWSSTQDQYTQAAVYNGTTWSSDLTLYPGTGALLQVPGATPPSLFYNTFLGIALNFDGSLWNGTSPFQPPPPFSGPSGDYLLASAAPVALSGNIFDPSQNEYPVWGSIVGRAPINGESFTTLVPSTGDYSTTTFVNGAWNNGTPSLALGQAAMFNLLAVPEPSVLGLLTLGFGALAATRRWGAIQQP